MCYWHRRTCVAKRVVISIWKVRQKNHVHILVVISFRNYDILVIIPYLQNRFWLNENVHSRPSNHRSTWLLIILLAQNNEYNLFLLTSIISILRISVIFEYLSVGLIKQTTNNLSKIERVPNYPGKTKIKLGFICFYLI